MQTYIPTLLLQTQQRSEELTYHIRKLQGNLWTLNWSKKDAIIFTTDTLLDDLKRRFPLFPPKKKKMMVGNEPRDMLLS